MTTILSYELPHPHPLQISESDRPLLDKRGKPRTCSRVHLTLVGVWTVDSDAASPNAPD